MQLHTGDLHLVFNDTTNVCKLFRRGNDISPLLVCEMRNDTVRWGFGRWGRCPRGFFQLGTPSAVKMPAFGYWFIPLFDLGLGGPMFKEQRRGIGIHGGGTGLENPFAYRQGWKPTHGCLRVQNEDLDALAHLIGKAFKDGQRCYCTVAGIPSG